MKRYAQAATQDQAGVAMIEATIGTVLLLFSALVVIQITLFFHGSLAAHTAAMKVAREYAVTESYTAMMEVYGQQTRSSLKAVTWGAEPNCNVPATSDVVTCTISVTVPAVLPGSSILGGGGLTDPFPITEIGVFPRGGI